MLAKQFSNLVNNELKYTNVFKGHVQGIENVKFLQQTSNKFASCSHDNTIKIWDINTQKNIETFKNIHEDGIWDFVLNEQHGSILTISPDAKLVQTDLRNGQQIKVLDTNMEKGYSISKQDDQLLIGGQNGNLTLVNEQQMEIQKEFSFKDQIVYKTQAIGNGNWMVSTDLGKIHLFDSNLNEIFNQKIYDKELRAFLVFEEHIYMSCKNHKIQKFQLDIDNKKITKILENDGHQDEVRCFQVDSQNKLLFTGSADSSLFVWSTENLGFRHNLIGHIDLVSSIDINYQSQQLITGSWDQTCLNFDLQKIKLN